MLQWASVVAQWYRICLSMQETQVQSLGWGGPLERRNGTPTPVFLLRILRSLGATVCGVTKTWTRLSTYHQLVIKEQGRPDK